MTQRQDILQEYFSLVKDLNQTNKFKNEQTQIRFEIEAFAGTPSVLFSKISNDQKIRLCNQVSCEVWRVDNSCKYVYLAQWMVILLQQYNIEKINLKMTFNDFFKIKFNALLAFKS